MNILTSKTFWAGLSGIVAAAGGYATGDFTAPAAIQMAFTGLIGILLRHGMSKQAE